MRLIDADAYKKYLDENWIVANYNAIDAQPTIEAEPVIRCKDCKYRDADGYCQVLGDMFIHWEDWTPVPDDFFCARGTRS